MSTPRARVLSLGSDRPSIEVLEAGDGPPLLFLHGADGVPAWVGALPLLAERFRVVAPLLPGFGQSRGLEYLDDPLDLVASLGPDGAAVIGMPSLNSQAYASPQSKIGHINCKQAPEIKALLQEFFAHVFIFSMNDEVVHTGFHAMAHYYLALCCGRR